MHLRYTTDPQTSLWLNRRRVGATIPIPLASSGIVYLAHAGDAEARELRALVRDTYPTLPLDDALITRARQAGHAFSPNDTREQSLSLPIIQDGKVAAVLLIMFMARAQSRDDVTTKYLPRLRAMAAWIAREAATTERAGAR